MPKRVKPFEEYSRSYRYKIIKFLKDQGDEPMQNENDRCMSESDNLTSSDADDEVSMQSLSNSLNLTESNDELEGTELGEAQKLMIFKLVELNKSKRAQKKVAKIDHIKEFVDEDRQAWFDGWRDNESHNSTPSSENSDIALDDLSFDALINERTLENGSTNGVLDDELEEELSGKPATTMVETEEARLKRIISLTRHIPVFSGEDDVEPFIDAIEYCTPRLKDGDEETFIFELASRLSGVAVGSMRTVMKTARTIDAVIEKLRQNFGRTEDFFAILNRLTKLLQEENESVARFGARLESMRSQAANKIDRITLTADQKQYRNNDLNAAALETFIVGLTPQLSFAVSTQKPRNLTDALKVALEAEIQSEKTEAMNKLREDRVRRRERDHARIRLATYRYERCS
ncbi:hypothetical protein KQX54_010544 [Cotesia glomerata]|uniref:Uncharacterized protein n=1 Tax=Cotesia glomerata TaxID=32391 RepID=A0AAV7IK18_COTGL|nr:hypothetical protein KQX54_010544 [Cotesia glomerata]